MFSIFQAVRTCNSFRWSYAWFGSSFSSNFYVLLRKNLRTIVSLAKWWTDADAVFYSVSRRMIISRHSWANCKIIEHRNHRGVEMRQSTKWIVSSYIYIIISLRPPPYIRVHIIFWSDLQFYFTLLYAIRIKFFLELFLFFFFIPCSLDVTKFLKSPALSGPVYWLGHLANDVSLYSSFGYRYAFKWM